MFGNKDLIKIMFKCGLNYQMNILHIAYNNQQFEPIKYTCDV